MQVIDLPDPTEPQSVCFAPDGRLLAVCGFGKLFLADTATGTARLLWVGESMYGLGPAAVGFTADGAGVVLHHDWPPRHEVCVHDLEAAAVVTTLPLNRYEKCQPGPGGRAVYVAAKPKPGWVDTELVRWNPLTGAEQRVVARHKHGAEPLAVSADERWAAGASGDSVRVWNLGGARPAARASQKFTFERGFVNTLVLSADGAFLAIVNHSGPDMGVLVADVRAAESWRAGESPGIRGFPGNTRHDLTFHPARPVLAMRGGPGEVVFHDAAARAELRRYAWDVGPLSAVAFSPDGLRCAAAGPGKVVVWDVDV